MPDYSHRWGRARGVRRGGFGAPGGVLASQRAKEAVRNPPHSQGANVSESFRVSLSARSFVNRLSLVAAVLVVLHMVMWTVYFKTSILDNEGHWISLLDLDTEASLGTWYSSILLFLGGALTLIQVAGRRERDAWDGWWWFIGIALLMASLDEVAGFHESLNTDPHFTALLGQWTVAGAILSAVLGVLVLPFLWRLPMRTRVLLILSGVVYVSGAVGVEFATIGYERDNLLNTLPYNLWNALEEGLEMAGIILYLYALLDWMAGAKDAKSNLQVDARP